MNLVHRAVRAVSFGRVGWKLGSMPVVELTTIGRKSGQSHTVMLTTPLTVDGAVVIVASRGGDDRHPAWFLNLQANPDVIANVGGAGPNAMRAQVAELKQREELWATIAAKHRNYAGYQAKTDRKIPLVLLRLVDK